ncbi:MAG: hypothetical protein E6J61_07280 [Deltaproteobacteria bacterium]|nr:MAG: hypothetical protein E6J61_07280 [Deltaproteobacteria bacterium]
MEQNDNASRQHTVPIIDLSSLPSYLSSPSIPVYLQGTDDVGPQCHCHLQLQVPNITDQDPTIDLQARWYVDYDLGTPPSQLPAAVPTDLPGSFSQPGLSRGGVAFDIDADALAPGIHVIELVVAEKQGFAPDNANVILPHRSLLLGFDGTTLKIVVEVKPVRKLRLLPRRVPFHRRGAFPGARRSTQRRFALRGAAVERHRSAEDPGR